MWLTPGQRKNGKVDAKFPQSLTRRVLPLEEVPYPEFRPVLTKEDASTTQQTDQPRALP